MPKQIQELEAKIIACCKGVEDIDRVALRALQMAERIRAAVGTQRRDMMARLQELLRRVEDLERRRR